MLSTSVLINTYRCKLSTAQAWAPVLGAAARFCDADLDSNRLACFLAQVGHESGRLRYTREIWGPTAQQLRYDYGTTLAKTLGNFRPGDGKLFMGRGLIQITGRLNYRMASLRMKKFLSQHAADKAAIPEVPDFEEAPTELERPYWAAMSAALYWNTRNLNTYADAHDFVGLTHRINGGINGLADRQALYAAAFSSMID